jgi:predicted deacylase
MSIARVRAFPSRPDGCFTGKIAFGITELVRRERVDLTVDLHEARPMNPIVNCVIFHERA